MIQFKTVNCDFHNFPTCFFFYVFCSSNQKGDEGEPGPEL